MKSIISLTVFSIIAIFVWWTTTDKNDDDAMKLQTQSIRYIELYMDEFELTAMDKTGTPSYNLQGEHLEKYNNSDDTEIIKPVIHLLQAGKQWIISADFALINDKNETIQLKKNVVMQQQNSEPAVTIRTQTIMIHTSTQIAKTLAQVDITQGKSHLQSIGMIYNNITGELELSSSVNGYYLPYE